MSDTEIYDSQEFDRFARETDVFVTDDGDIKPLYDSPYIDPRTDLPKDDPNKPGFKEIIKDKFVPDLPLFEVQTIGVDTAPAAAAESVAHTEKSRKPDRSYKSELIEQARRQVEEGGRRGEAERKWVMQNGPIRRERPRPTSADSVLPRPIITPEQHEANVAKAWATLREAQARAEHELEARIAAAAAERQARLNETRKVS